jgi:hypothetical protein
MTSRLSARIESSFRETPDLPASVITWVNGPGNGQNWRGVGFRDPAMLARCWR